MMKKLFLSLFDTLMRISIRFSYFAGPAVHSILGIMAVLFVACGLILGLVGRGWTGAWLFVLLGLLAGFFPILRFIAERLTGELSERIEELRIAERIHRLLKQEARERNAQEKNRGKAQGRTQEKTQGDVQKSSLEKELEEIDRRTARRAAGLGAFTEEEWVSSVKSDDGPDSEIDRATRDLESALLQRQRAKEEEKRRQMERDRLEEERMERIRKQQEEFRKIDEEKKRVEREAMEKLQRQRREKEAKEYKAREKRRQEQERFWQNKKTWGAGSRTSAAGGSTSAKGTNASANTAAVGSGYFAGVSSLSGLKKRYKELMKAYHPDNGDGNVEAMNRVQKEYDELLRFFKKVDSHR